jgi:thiol-disulfide isomerase/thioredoxin
MKVKTSSRHRLPALLPAAALIAALSAALFAGPARALEPGDAAPAFELPGTTSNVSLARLRGKVVYLDFWASWCGPCRQSFPWMNEMQARYGSKGLTVVAINLDAKPADAQAFLAEVPASFTVGFDRQGDIPRSYEIKGMPSSVLVGRDGKVIQVHAGFRSDERQVLEDAIAAALSAPR